eukprot:1536385-Alexandrium_andersonii.AAC.1
MASSARSSAGTRSRASTSRRCTFPPQSGARRAVRGTGGKSRGDFAGEAGSLVPLPSMARGTRRRAPEGGGRGPLWFKSGGGVAGKAGPLAPL